MTRKDTILIAVVINAGLLAVLFTTAVIYDTDKGMEPIDFSTPLVENQAPPSSEPPSNLIAAASTGDEVDNVLKYYTSPPAQPLVVPILPEEELLETVTLQPNEEEVSEPFAGAPLQEEFIEVKVKRGDVLEKIARANKTTVGAIKRVNHLESERLSIGQVLKIPLKQKHSLAASSNAARGEPEKETKQEKKKEPQAAEAEPVYYVIKSGDNPWKIAKQFGVKYDEILRLNHMSEEKARNLKIGDRIRIK